MLNIRTPRRISLRHLRKYTHRWHKPIGYDTGIQVYSCVTRSNVPLVLRNKHIATWYTCGPTVYDSSHLGHASCYVKLDIIQRILRDHFKINLVTAMNITDIDDKIIKRSQENGKPWKEMARSYETEFWSDMRKLRVIEPNVKIRVTENIPQIVAFIEKLIQKGSAYVGPDKSVYFDVSTHSDYGKLQRVPVEEKGHETKASAMDFALWKARKEENEPSWSAPWSEGRPGWHIECSVLASMIFGSGIDIHAGGLDLRFPHHENEEAQSCVYHNTPQWVNYWLHTGHLNILGQTEKMSKSLKNTISIDDMLRSYSTDEFRMACLLSNYRNSVEYGDEMMLTARSTLKRFFEFNSNVQAYLEGKKRGVSLDTSTILQALDESTQQIDKHLKDDFDTARCVGVLAELTSTVSRYINAPTREEVSASSLDCIGAVGNFVKNNLQVFGFQMDSSSHPTYSSLNLDALLEDVVETRHILRERAIANKNQELFKVCDELRHCLKRNGVELKDHSQGTTWSLLK